MKKSIFLCAFLVLLAMVGVKAQTWTQVGNDIDGEAVDDESGSSVSINATGNILAVGARYNATNGNDAGQVKVYENIDGNWTQIGNDINGEAAEDESGFSVSLSAGGNILAIGAPMNDGNGTDAGQVRVFENIGGNWTQIGSDIDGEFAGDKSGSAISLSANGTTLAIGSIVNAAWAGQVRVFENISGTWTQTGEDIIGENESDQSGCSVSLSANGNIVAIGAFGNSDNGTPAAGQVRVYEKISGTWTQIGQDINGISPESFSGYSVSLNANGNILAIGSPNDNYSGQSAGLVRVFQNITGTWTQIGDNIEGDWFDELGYSVCLNANGNKIAIGARTADAGFTKVYENVSGNWFQTGNTIAGEDLNEFPEISVSLNSNGNIVAIGAPYNSGNGEAAGHVRVFQQCNATAPPVPNVATLPNVTAECLVTTLTPPTATDGCGNTVTGTPNITLPILAQGTTTVTWIYNSGTTSSTQTQNVVIDDVTNPTITCVGNQTVNADESHFYTVNGIEFDPLVTSDNCGIASVVNLYTVSFSLAGAQIPEGTTTISWLITDNAGNNQPCSFEVTVNAFVGLETLQQKGISVYPNPANKVLHVGFSETNSRKLSISDMTGRVVSQKTTSNQTETIDLSEFLSGVYVVSIQTDQEMVTTKIVIEQ
ncbi:MAG: T9SS type A sorting domain-containing protein [Sphingobacteriales bacterium]|nr:MAG: T9SS type A sorting domain-containing protein [Sphingobacteriales bacterium]